MRLMTRPPPGPAPLPPPGCCQASLAICVGNCQPEVAAWARAARAAGGRSRVHLARPEAEAAAGVEEGLAAFGFFSDVAHLN
jgi:hypothetical protein